MRDPVVVERQLAERAARMDFFQAVRLLENAYPHLPRIGTALRPRDEAVRFGQEPSLGFEPGALRAYTPADASRKARLTVNFVGLLGANGPLPLHLTEYARERSRNHGDGTLVAFLDIFHHRALSLFYRARACAEPAISLDRPDSDRFGDYVGCLCGIGSPALQQRDDIGDFAKRHFAGLLANGKRPAAGLATILRAYYRLPVRIEQFVGHWMPIPAHGQTRIGREQAAEGLGQGVGRGVGNRLGTSAVLGKAVWDCQHRFRLVFGPLDHADYLRLLPGTPGMRRLQAWVRQYAGIALDWDVRLVLKKEQVPPLALTSDASRARRLGWTTYLASAPATRDADRLTLRGAARAA
ncbi:type VI secretion system baseplate subunit TssG [Pseudoduganella lutea]|uniref:Type VI secretion system baseplate subunit TssG n=1 Tax=Pseudoduganella lutea TaxID=321985 RepID=A0A4P6L6X8_9BURK|nr:type VI secretion system baseplate subunit TssG [Pseudoduganella lutea]QBE66708.1 type VI secretion system baseplate subunit TssG [Pseudoduganella lutea]